MVSEVHRYQYLIALGSNLGDRGDALRQAQQLILSRCGLIAACASTYETAPVGAADQKFLNSALICHSAIDPEEFLAELLAIEIELGRVRTVRWGNRTIDLDLLLCRRRDDVKPVAWESPSLTLPHPEILARDFVLVPAVEIAADWVHPASGRALEDELALLGYALRPQSRAFF